MKRIVIAGASGMIGRALSAALRAEGVELVKLVRRRPAASDEVQWNPAAGELAPTVLSGATAVVNLAGANIAAGRWTERRRKEIRTSRIEATRTLVQALAAAEPRPRVLVSASATGFYGEGGDTVLTEQAGPGRGFLAEVCCGWEQSALAAETRGVRTVCLRFGVVLAPDGGALARMLPVFRCGLGGRLGSGRQWMSWIALDDAVAAIRWSLAQEVVRGPVNAVAPTAVTNAEFTAELAKAVRRPAWWPVPATALRLVFGRMADETLLASARVEPAVLRAGGFGFGAPELGEWLRRNVT